MYVTDFKGNDPRFVYHFLGTLNLSGFNSGSAQPSLNRNYIYPIEILVPEPHEQREIASILGALDDKIELNRRMAATLEEMARALYRSWFVDFDPVKAKAEGLAPAFMDDATAALFPDRFGEDGLPEGWRRRPIGELISDAIGGDWGKEVPDDQNNRPVCIIRGTDMPGIMDGGTAGVPTRYTTMKKVEKRVLRPFDIVLEVSGGSPTQPTGRTLLITEAELSRFDHAMVPASFCRRLRPVTEPVGMIAFLHAQQLYLEGGTWNYQNQSTGISNFQTPRFLQEEMVALPNDDTVINAFYSFAKSWISKARSNENIKLSALRDTLLPKLMSGELRVGQTRDKIEEVA
jgi:type I restriction enzyme S subunit